jgi:hypothetical protein
MNKTILTDTFNYLLPINGYKCNKILKSICSKYKDSKDKDSKDYTHECIYIGHCEITDYETGIISKEKPPTKIGSARYLTSLNRGRSQGGCDWIFDYIYFVPKGKSYRNLEKVIHKELLEYKFEKEGHRELYKLSPGEAIIKVKIIIEKWESEPQDSKDMIASNKGIIGNQQYRETVDTLPAYEPKPRTTKPKPKAKAPAPVVEQPVGKRYTYTRPMTYEGDYCKVGMVVEMSIKRLWVKGVAMRLAYYPSEEGNWVGLNAQWRGRRFLNLQRASKECCVINQITNSPNAWSAFKCINPESLEHISIERLDKHPNWADCNVLMRGDEEEDLLNSDGEEEEDA